MDLHLGGTQFGTRSNKSFFRVINYFCAITWCVVGGKYLWPSLLVAKLYYYGGHRGAKYGKKVLSSLDIRVLHLLRAVGLGNRESRDDKLVDY